MPADELYNLLKEIHDTLDVSAQSYREYLAGGKTFRFAQQLKKHNSHITHLLNTKKEILPPTLQQAACALLIHYNTWTIKWEQLAAAIHPQPDDVFVFENDITFPRAAAGMLEAAWLEAKES